MQSRRIVIPSDAHAPDYAGVAEIWFDDEAALLEARQSPKWKASSDDELNFIDQRRTAYIVAREHILLDEGSASGAK